jgi:parallel beta-helix repeat protein
MKIRKRSGVMLILLLFGLSVVAFRLQPVKASGGTVYIRADGSIDPPTAPIYTHDNVTYTLTAPISGSLVIERNNIVFDGASYALRGNGSGNGVNLTDRGNVTIKNTRIQNFAEALMLSFSSNNTISGDSVTDSVYGIALDHSSNNSISENSVTSSKAAIALENSSDSDAVSGNNFRQHLRHLPRILYQLHGFWKQHHEQHGSQHAWSSPRFMLRMHCLRELRSTQRPWHPALILV